MLSKEYKSPKSFSLEDFIKDFKEICSSVFEGKPDVWIGTYTCYVKDEHPRDILGFNNNILFQLDTNNKILKVYAEIRDRYGGLRFKAVQLYKTDNIDKIVISNKEYNPAIEVRGKDKIFFSLTQKVE